MDFLAPRRALGEARRALRAQRYRGTAYVDPICGRSFRALIGGSNDRPNAWCPRCHSAERHRLLWLFLTRETGVLSEPLRVLHVAPEAGLARRLRGLHNLRYTTTDLLDPAADVRADLTALPFVDGEFDMVLCNHVLEHIPDDRAAMRELRRVLAPAGQAVMQHPIDADRAETFEDWAVTTAEGRARAFLHPEHVRIYGRDFEDRLQEAGFGATKRIRYQERLAPEERERYRTEQFPSATPERDLEADVIYIASLNSPTSGFPGS